MDMHQQYEQLKVEKVEPGADRRSCYLDGVEMDCGKEGSLLVACYLSWRHCSFVCQRDPKFGVATFLFGHSPIELLLKAVQIAYGKDEKAQGDLVDSR